MQALEIPCRRDGGFSCSGAAAPAVNLTFGAARSRVSMLEDGGSAMFWTAPVACAQRLGLAALEESASRCAGRVAAEYMLVRLGTLGFQPKAFKINDSHPDRKRCRQRILRQSSLALPFI